MIVSLLPLQGPGSNFISQTSDEKTLVKVESRRSGVMMVILTVLQVDWKKSGSSQLPDVSSPSAYIASSSAFRLPKQTEIFKSFTFYKWWRGGPEISYHHNDKTSKRLGSYETKLLEKVSESLMTWPCLWWGLMQHIHVVDFECIGQFGNSICVVSSSYFYYVMSR